MTTGEWIAGSIVLVLPAASLAVWFVWILRMLAGHSPIPVDRRDVPLPSGPAFAVATCYVLMLLAAILMPATDARELTADDVHIVVAQQFVMFAALLAFDAIPFRKEPPGLWVHARLHSRDVVRAVELLIAAIAPVFLVLALTFPFRSPETQHALLKLLTENPSFEVIGWLLISTTLLAPLIEEYLFRVILQERLRLLLPRWGAIVTVAVLFSAVHGWPDAVPLLPLALILGYGYEQTRSFPMVVMLHGTFNMINIVLAWLTAGSV